MFLHEVALVGDISEPRYVGGHGYGGRRIGGQIRYVIFDTAAEAVEFAAGCAKYLKASVDHRNWHPSIFHASRIDDRRGESTCGTC